MNSLPITRVGFMRLCTHFSQEKMCRSLPQIPAFSTRIRTSEGPSSGTGTSQISNPGLGAVLQSARMKAILFAGAIGLHPSLTQAPFEQPLPHASNDGRYGKNEQNRSDLRAARSRRAESACR